MDDEMATTDEILAELKNALKKGCMLEVKLRDRVAAKIYQTQDPSNAQKGAVTSRIREGIKKGIFRRDEDSDGFALVCLA